MCSFDAVNPESALCKTRELLDQVQRSMGMTPNMIKVLANAPDVLEGYLGFSGALAQGVLPRRLREQLALTVSEVHDCDYCLAARTAIGKMVGLSEQEIADARQGTSVDVKTEVALRFARKLVQERGRVENADIKRLAQVGFDQQAIIEIVAHVAMSTFTNYFNHVASTAVDFPAVEPLAQGTH
jgi:uncharacterized peroxidase-related enzyme